MSRLIDHDGATRDLATRHVLEQIRANLGMLPTSDGGRMRLQLVVTTSDITLQVQDGDTWLDLASVSRT